MAVSASLVRKQGEIKIYSDDDPVQGNVLYSALEHFDWMLARVRWQKKVYIRAFTDHLIPGPFRSFSLRFVSIARSKLVLDLKSDPVLKYTFHLALG